MQSILVFWFFLKLCVHVIIYCSILSWLRCPSARVVQSVDVCTSEVTSGWVWGEKLVKTYFLQPGEQSLVTSASNRGLTPQLQQAAVEELCQLTRLRSFPSASILWELLFHVSAASVSLRNVSSSAWPLFGDPLQSVDVITVFCSTLLHRQQQG